MTKLSTNFIYQTEIKLNGVVIPTKSFNSLYIEKNFMKNRFPLQILSMSIPPDKLHKILRDVDISQPMIDVSLTVYHEDADNETDAGKVYMSGEYVGITDKPFINYSPYADGVSTDDKVSSGENKSETIRLALWNEDDINAFRHGYVNGVYQNFNVTQAIMKGFKDCTDGSLQLCLSPPDNQNVYEQDIWVPMGFYQFMNYIDNEMGIYDTDYNIFIEDNIVYFLNGKNEHGVIPKVDDPYTKSINVHLIPSQSISQIPGVSFMDTIDYHITVENDFTSNIDLDRFGRRQSFRSILEELDFTVGDESVNTVNIFSNRLNYHGKKKYDKENFTLNFNNLPFKARPYTRISLSGEITNNIYRVVGYVTVIHDTKAFTKVNLKRNI